MSIDRPATGADRMNAAIADLFIPPPPHDTHPSRRCVTSVHGYGCNMFTIVKVNNAEDRFDLFAKAIVKGFSLTSISLERL